MNQKRSGLFRTGAGLLILIMLLLLIRLYSGLRIVRLADRAWEQDAMICDVELVASDWSGGAIFSWQEMTDGRYFSMGFGEEILYFHDNSVCFSNGRGYSLSSLLDGLNIPKNYYRKALFFAGFERSKAEARTCWTYSLPEEPGLWFRLLFPEAERYWSRLRSLKLILDEEAGLLKRVSVHHDQFRMLIHLRQEEPAPIPTEAVMALGIHSLPDIRQLEPLLRAGLAIAETDMFSGELSMKVSCGPLPIEDTATLELSGDRLFLRRGDHTLDLTPEGIDRNELLLGLGWMLLREGEWESLGENTGYLRTVIPAEKMKETLIAILPELSEIDYSLNDGTLIVSVGSNSLQEVTLTCDGELPFLITTIPLSVQLQLTVKE